MAYTLQVARTWRRIRRCRKTAVVDSRPSTPYSTSAHRAAYAAVRAMRHSTRWPYAPAAAVATNNGARKKRESARGRSTHASPFFTLAAWNSIDTTKQPGSVRAAANRTSRSTRGNGFRAATRRSNARGAATAVKTKDASMDAAIITTKGPQNALLKATESNIPSDSNQYAPAAQAPNRRKGDVDASSSERLRRTGDRKWNGANRSHAKTLPRRISNPSVVVDRTNDVAAHAPTTTR
mmetsp:Transcript_13722/g.42480  ORF Transcript_13722/g.42480 Transcript_13722/m.42480 type:complete len:237 (-) Transcript_13722:942-1652(-)